MSEDKTPQASGVTDQGGLQVDVVSDRAARMVVLRFGAPIVSLGLRLEQADQLSRLLAREVRALRGRNVPAKEQTAKQRARMLEAQLVATQRTMDLQQKCYKARIADLVIRIARARHRLAMRRRRLAAVLWLELRAWRRRRRR